MEWERVTCLAALGLLDAGLEAGDRIANLFAAGDLYVSFDMMMMSMSKMPMPAAMIPLGYTLPPTQMCDRIEQCHATVLLGHPTVLFTLAKYCVQHQRIFSTVTKIMYAGETLFDHQVLLLKQAFPQAIVRPNLYGSVDCGLIASSAASRDNNNDRTLFKVFRHTIWMEIVTEDDTPRVIEKNNVSGAVVVTNLSRQLQPVIRYPTGDRAEWIDFDRGIFRLGGRVNSLLRLGTWSVDIEDIRLLIGHCSSEFKTVQIIIRQEENGRDEVECLIAAKPCDERKSRRQIVDALRAKFPDYVRCVENGWLAPLKVSFVSLEEMHLANSGKLRSLVDFRFKSKE